MPRGREWPPRWLSRLVEAAGCRALEKAVYMDPLTAGDVARLLVEAPFHALSAAADAAARMVKMGVGSYTVNAYVAYSNVCVTACSFCSFYRPRGHREAYTLSPGEAAGLVARLHRRHMLREVHIVGGNNPDLPLEYYTGLVRAVAEAAPGAVVKAFTAEEIDFISRTHRVSIRELLLRLRGAGLSALTGGGAEILSPRVHRLLAPRKTPPERWLRVHEEAHRLGIRSNATIVYGHVEEPPEVGEHLVSLRRLQERTGGFVSLILVRYNPLGNPLGRSRLYRGSANTSGVYDLRLTAAARLALLGAIDNIVAYWVSMGPQLAEAALAHGANDLGGTFYMENVVTPARTGERRTQGRRPEELALALLEAGWRPAERDTFYNYYPPRLPAATHQPWLLEEAGGAAP